MESRLAELRSSEQPHDRHFKFPEQFDERRRTHQIGTEVPVPQALDATSAFKRVGPFEYSKNLLVAPSPGPNGTPQEATNGSVLETFNQRLW